MRACTRRLAARLKSSARSCELADLTLITQGITFTVYGDAQGIEKPFPVDLIPRVLPAKSGGSSPRG